MHSSNVAAQNVAPAKPSSGDQAQEKKTHRPLRDVLVPIPLAFLGLGVYRAWIEITFVGSFVGFQAFSVSMRDIFDLTAIVEMLACVALARRIGPLFNRARVYILCGSFMLLSTVLLFASSFMPSIALELCFASSVLGGLGLGLIILIFSELYGCLNPIRVTLYYASSLVFGALIVYVYMGFKMPWLFAMTALLPVAALLCARRAFGLLPEGERPQKTWVSVSVPWKIMLLMGFFAFSYGIIESSAYRGAFGPHSSPGTFIVAVLVVIGVLVRRDKFDFNVLCRIALPLTVVALFSISVFGFADDVFGGYCVAGGYTAFTILIMVLCSNLCYRYGVSAIWLFGLERSLRLVFMFLGRCVYEYGSMIDVGGVHGTTIAIVDRCELLAKRFGLTSRETEVLMLLAQRKTVGQIEHELFIANGTAKAHVRHVYQKFDIHSREELFDLIGIDGLQSNAEAPVEELAAGKHA